MKTRRKLIAIVLSVVLIIAMLATPVFATTITETDHLTPGTGITTLALTGVTTYSSTRTDENYTAFNYTNTRYTYNIELPSDTTDGTQLTITFTPASGVTVSSMPAVSGPVYQFTQMILGAASNTYTVSLSGGTASKTVYVHHNLSSNYGKFDTYIFNFSLAAESLPVTELSDTGNTNLVMQFGDPNVLPTSPEQDMYFVPSGTEHKYNVIYNGDLSAYYPDTLAFFITSGASSITSMNGGSAVHFVEYNTAGDVVYEGSSPNGSTALTAGFYALKILTEGDLTIQANSKTLILHFYAPHEAVTPATGALKAVNGYLPVGQFATGSGWGALYTDGTNNGTTKKFASGYTSTGVSLGMLGGYIQFDADPNNTGVRIANDSDNPYGIDFIVYGNAFVGNPEAASVMVSEDGNTWYNLAGSRHYKSGTNQIVNISYIKIASDNTTIGTKTFSTAGIYYSKNYVPTASTTQSEVNAAISEATWSGIPKKDGTTVVYSTNAWPEYDSEHYGNVWNDGTVTASGATATGKVYWNRSGSAEVITYCGVVEVQDDMAYYYGVDPDTTPSQPDQTDFYLWGYGDVRANGSSYGTAINPYASNPSVTSGGDGFDLSWAVDSSGNPVSISSVRYIRVYSSVLCYDPQLGETSAEVCGVYATSGSNTNTNPTNRAKIRLDNSDDYIQDDGTEVSTTQRLIVKTVTAGSHTIKVHAGSDLNLFVNGTKYTGTSKTSPYTDTVSLSAGQSVTYQIITQTSDRQPSVIVLRLTCPSSN